MMRAVWMRARAELRARRKQIISLALLLGLLGGVVIAAAGGARRTHSAYRDFLAEVNAPTLTMYAGDLPAFGLDYHIDVDELASYPEVEDAAFVDLAFVRTVFDNGVTFQPYEAALELGSVPLEERRIGRPVLVSGRFPDPARPDEVVVPFSGLPLIGARIGDSLTFELIDPDLARMDVVAAAEAPPVGSMRATIVGTIAMPQSFSAVLNFSFAAIFGTPALHEAIGDRTLRFREIWPILADGAEESFDSRIREVTGGPYLSLALDDIAELAEREPRVRAAALGLFALLLGLALAFIAIQSVSRLVFTGRDDSRTLAAVGFARRQRVLVQIIQTALVGMLAAAIAAGVGIGLAPFTVWGEVEIMSPGAFRVDLAIVSLGAGSLALIVALGGIPAAVRASSASTEAMQSGTRRPSRLVSWLAGSGAPPSMVAGARLAVERGRGRTASPVGSTIVSSAIGIAALVALLVFGSSMNHLLNTPALTGSFHDTLLGFPGQDLEEVIPPVLEEASDLVDGYAAGNAGEVQIRMRGPAGAARSVPMLAFDLVGDIEPTILAGEWPDASGEIALGSKTMRALGVSLGERVELLIADDESPVSVEVVGRAVMPNLHDDPAAPQLGVGAGMSLQGMREVLGPDVPMNLFPVRLADGVTAEELIAVAPDALAPPEGDFREAVRPPDLEALAQVTSAPAIVSGVLVLLAAATLTHGVLTAVRRRRRDLATLKALGFGRRQLRATVAWQASLLTLLATFLAIPLGLLGGRWAWLTFTDSLGVVPVVTVPLVLVAVVIPSAIVVADLVSIGPARTAARTQPADVLRSE